MAKNDVNRKRIFAEVVSIDAWHKPFGENRDCVDIHADVTFSTARLGGESSSKITFRLSLRRAEVVVVLAPTEPAEIVRSSVAREVPKLNGKRVQTHERKKSASGSIKAKLQLAANKVRGAVDVEAAASASAVSTDKLQLTETVDLFFVKQTKTAEGDYRWELSPRIGEELDGRPWDPQKSPRLKVRDTRTNRKRGIPPTVSVAVRCLREDMHISDIKMKDEKLWEKVKSTAGFANRLAAAEAYIRDRLLAEGLEFSDLSDRFGAIVLATVTAEPEDPINE